MATISEVKNGLAEVAQVIETERKKAKSAKATITAVENNLASIGSRYNKLITEVNGYTPTGAFETLAQDELDKLTSEFQTLKTAVTTAKTALAAITEF